MTENATKCSAADGVTQTFRFGHGTPIMVRAVDFNAQRAEITRLQAENAALHEREGRTRVLVKQCHDALAEELAAWCIDPPIAHIKNAHDACVSWLAGE